MENKNITMKDEEREFQLEMLWIQVKSGIIASMIFSGILSFLVAIITVALSVPQVLNVSEICIFIILVAIGAVIISGVVVACKLKDDISNLRKKPQ
jgi:ABC-type antimicrobial peptide transport system permease subunit